MSAIAKNNPQAYAGLRKIVGGAIRDTLKSHPDYVRPSQAWFVEQSLAKRICGAVMGFAVQARGRSYQTAETDAAECFDGRVNSGPAQAAEGEVAVKASPVLPADPEAPVHVTSQNATILHHLKTRGGITAREASRGYGIERLSARIFDIKDAGHQIASIPEMVTNRHGKEVRVSRYFLKASAQ